MKAHDVDTVCTWMGPGWIMDAARDYGDGCPVTGAPRAYDEARRLTREYIRYVRWRDDERVLDMRLPLLLRAIGYAPNQKHVLPLDEDDWRVTATEHMWSSPAPIPGAVHVNVGAADFTASSRAALCALSMAVSVIPGANRAVLQGQCWSRRKEDGHLLVHTSLRGNQVRSYLIDAAGQTGAYVGARHVKALRSLIKMETHELAEGVLAKDVAADMLRAWLDVGFIISPAAAMVSFAPKVPLGWGALVPANGIPLAFTLCRPEGGWMWITANVDHRAIDGETMGEIYGYLETEVPRLIGEDRLDERAARRRKQRNR